MHKLLIVLVLVLLTGCYSIMNPFSKSILREVLAEPPPPTCRLQYTKLYSDETTSCYCKIIAMTADGVRAVVVLEVKEDYCLRKSYEADK